MKGCGVCTILWLCYFSLVCSEEFDEPDVSYVLDEPQSYYTDNDNGNSYIENNDWNTKEYNVEKRDFIPVPGQYNEGLRDIAEDGEDLEKRNNLPEVMLDPNEKEGNSDESEEENSDESSEEIIEESGSGETDDSGKKREDISLNAAEMEEDSGSGANEDESANSEMYGNNEEQISHDTSPDTSESGTGETSEYDSGSSEDEPEQSRLIEGINVPRPRYDTEVKKKYIIPQRKQHVKRQYITRPRFVVRNGYVYMKAPPMTQKTIVTTHIPRPPMVMPYNTFLHRYHGGYGMPHRSHYMLPQQQMMEGGDDGFDVDDQHEESKLHIRMFIKTRSMKNSY